LLQKTRPSRSGCNRDLSWDRSPTSVVGYLAGLARGCVVENQRAALEREALDLASRGGTQ